MTLRGKLVTTAADLERLTKAATTEGRFGLDTEFLRERTYRARLCLMQISVADDVFVVDPLEIDDLSDVAAAVGDEDVEVVVHAGRQDFELMFERFGVLPKRVFDVQIAAGFTGLGASLPYGRLVESVLGVSLAKGEAYTDWCRRPLTDEQLHYAADDVRFLVPLADRLTARLSERGRSEWAEEEMRALESADSYSADPEVAWRRVAGRGTLSPRQTAILRELARWREQAAADRDLPRGWIVKDATLVEIARRAPTTLAALRAVRGLHPKEAERTGRDILAAIERGKRNPVHREERSLPRHVAVRARMLSGLADAVVRARCERAAVAPELVVTRGELDALLAEVVSGSVDETRHRVLKGWRKELAGDAVVAIATGRIAVKASESAPYVEEVPL